MRATITDYGRQFFTGLLITIACATQGCAVLEKSQDRTKSVLHRDPGQSETATPQATVSVGGGVRFPQTLSIPEAGMILQRAIYRVGGAEGALGTVAGTGVVQDDAEAPEQDPWSIIKQDREKWKDEAERLQAVYAQPSAPPDTLNKFKTANSINGFLVEVITHENEGKSPLGFLDAARLDAQQNLDPPMQQEVMDALSDLTKRLAPNRGAPLASAGSAKSLLVAIHRGQGMSAVSRYFPYKSVMDGLLGQVQLVDGDLVTVTTVGESPLASPILGRGKTFLAAGVVRESGPRPIFGSLPFSWLLGAGPEGVLPKGVEVNESLTLTINRLKTTGIGRDVFHIPVGMAQAVDALQTLSIVPGDEVTVLPAIQLPVIKNSIIMPIVAKRTAEAMAQLRKRQERFLKTTADENLVERATRRFRAVGTSLNDGAASLLQ